MKRWSVRNADTWEEAWFSGFDEAYEFARCHAEAYGGTWIVSSRLRGKNMVLRGF